VEVSHYIKYQSERHPSCSYPLDRRPWILTLPRTRIDKVNAELVTLTYGTIVAQLCSDFDSNYAEVNKQLDKMGYNIGVRLIEDYFAKSGTQRCTNFRETAEAISKASNVPSPVRAEASLTQSTGRLQDLPERDARRGQLVGRQQAVLAHPGGEPAGRLCRAAGRRKGAGRAVVLQPAVRRDPRRARDGEWAGGRWRGGG
jgi:hypothetical protein